MIKKLHMVAVMLMASALSVFAQTPKWMSTLDGSGNEITLNVAPSKDNNVFIMSKSFTKEATPSIDYFSVNMADGTTHLENTFMGVPDTYETSGNCNIVINKVDAQTGKLIWNIHSNKGGFDGGGTMTATPDNGLLIFFKVRHTSRGSMYPDTLLQLVDDEGVESSIKWSIDDIPNFGYAFQAVLVKVSADGKVEWMKHVPVGYEQLEKKANDCFNAGQVIVDEDSNIYVVGRYANSINFGPKANLQNPRNVVGWNGDPQQSRGDLFIVKMNAKGEPIWNVVSSGDCIEVENLDDAVLSNGKLYVGGYIKGDNKSTINFGNVKLVPGEKKSILYGCVNAANGDVEWAKVINSKTDEKNTRPNCKPVCLTVDGNDLYLGGSFAADLVTENGIILSSGEKMLKAYVIKCNTSDGAVQHSILIGPSISEIDAIDIVGDKVLASGYVLTKGAYLYVLDKNLSAETMKTQVVKLTQSGPTADGAVVGDMYVCASRAKVASTMPGLDWSFSQIEGNWACVFNGVPLFDMLAVNLYDSEKYQSKEDVTTNVVYGRKYENTEWQSLYLPFAMNYADWSADFDIARINDVHQFDTNGDGQVDKTQLEVIILGEGSTTEANVPYLVKAKNTGMQALRAGNALVKAAAPYQHDVTSWNTRFVVNGTYDGVTADDMFNNKYYAFSGGALMQVSKPIAMKGFRWYLDVQDRMGNPAATPSAITLRIVDENGNVTGVEEVEMSQTNGNVWPADVYNLQGKKVKANANSLQGLPKGVYIVNGKKVIL